MILGIIGLFMVLGVLFIDFIKNNRFTKKQWVMYGCIFAAMYLIFN